MRNSAELIRKGAIEIGSAVLPLMAMMYIVTYIGSGVEFILTHPSSSLWWVILFLIVLSRQIIEILGRFYARQILDDEVVDCAGLKSRDGRSISLGAIPNYVAVLLELQPTTLVERSFVTFSVVFVSFLILLWYRIRLEEEGLVTHTDYSAGMTSKGRFIP